MDYATLPAVKYIFTTGQVRSHYGGQTIAMMRRARLFATAGTPVTISTVDSWNGYPGLRDEWAASGVVVPGVTIRNIHEDYRAGDVRHLLRGAPVRVEPAVLRVPAGYRPYENPIDGVNMKRFWYPPESKQHQFTEYLRPDGSVFMRTLSNPGMTEWEEPARVVGFYDPVGQFVGGFSSHQEWWNHWMRSLVGEDQVVIINDYEHSLFFDLGRGPKVTKVQVIHSAHSQSIEQPGGAVKARWQRLDRGHDVADGLVFLTNWQEEDWAGRLHTNMQHRTIPHPVDVPATPREAESLQRRCVVVSRLDGNKNVADTIRAFQQATCDLEDAVLDIYGDGAEKGRLEALVAELDIQEKVRFYGTVAAAREQYRAARLNISTSKTEGFGLSILEALTRGCPVVSYDIRYGPSEMIEDGQNGYLIKAGDVAGAATAIRSILTDDDLALRLSRGAVARAAEYSEKNVTAMWADFIDDLL